MSPKKDLVSQRYKAAAFLDVDLTLVRGHLVEAFAEYLVDQKILTNRISSVTGKPSYERPERREILVVEDQGDQLQLLETALSTKYDVVTSSEPKQVVDKLRSGEYRQGHPDLILTDIRMPGIDGFEIAKEAIERGIPTILISAVSGQDVYQQLIKSRAAGFIQKPYQTDDLFVELDRVFADYKTAVEGVTGLERIAKEAKEYEDRVNEVLYSLATGIRGRSGYQIRIEAEKFVRKIDQYIDLFPFTSSLIRLLEDKRYLPVLISGGGPIEVISAFSRSLNIENSFSTIFEEEGERFTGELGASVGPVQKKEIVEAFSRKHGIDLHKSTAIGDSLFDVPMLEVVGYPIVMLPQKPRMKEIAERPGLLLPDCVRKEKWLICEGLKTAVEEVDGYLPSLR